MSMGGGWFFLTASEAVTVFIGHKGTNVNLPRNRELHGGGGRAGLRPESLHSHRRPWWSSSSGRTSSSSARWWPVPEKFRMETSESGDQPRSIVLGVLRASSVLRALGRTTRPVRRALDSVFRPSAWRSTRSIQTLAGGASETLAFWGVVTAVAVAGGVEGFVYLTSESVSPGSPTSSPSPRPPSVGWRSSS